MVMEELSKKEIMPVYSMVLIEFYEEDPYAARYTESGLKLSDDTFENPDTGNLEKKDFWIKTGKILDVGPEVKYIKEGDDIMVDTRSCRPVRFMGNVYFITAEQNIVAVIAENLKERYGKN